MLPVAVTTIPLVIIVGAVWLVLFLVAYPDVEYGSTNFLPADAPNGLLFWLMVVTWAWALFTAVGFAGSIVSVQRFRDGKPGSLSASLDPAFTRMGGLVVIGLTYYLVLVSTLLLAVTVIGAVLMVYCGLRLGLSVPAYMLEESSVRAAMGASWRLLGRHLLGFLAIVLVALPLLFVVLTAGALVFALVSLPFTGEELSRDATIVFNAIGVVVAGAAMVPTLGYLAAASTLYYLSRRESVSG